MAGLARLLAVALVLALQLPAHAEELLPPAVQAALIKKIFLFSTSMKQGSTTVLLVKGNEPDAQSAELAAAFTSVGLRAEVIQSTELAKNLPEESVLYAFPSAAAAVKAASAGQKKLSVSGFSALIDRSEVAVAVRRNAAGKAEIVISSARLKDAGHTFSSDLMSLAVVVD